MCQLHIKSVNVSREWIISCLFKKVLCQQRKRASLGQFLKHEALMHKRMPPKMLSNGHWKAVIQVVLPITSNHDILSFRTSAKRKKVCLAPDDFLQYKVLSCLSGCEAYFTGLHRPHFDHQDLPQAKCGGSRETFFSSMDGDPT